MFQECFSKVVVNVRCAQKQIIFTCELNLCESEKIKMKELIKTIRKDGHFYDEGDIFYFDHLKNDFVKIAQMTEICVFNLIHKNQIIIRCDPKMSDEILANPPANQSLKIKRSGQRGILQAFELVLRWRRLYMWGLQNQQGEINKYNLDQSASELGIPRKSLEDYFLLLRLGKQVGFNFQKHRNDKIGILRKYLKGIPKGQKQRAGMPIRQNNKQKIKILEDNFFRQLGRMLGSNQSKIGQQSIYDVLEVQSSRSFSDQEMLEEFQH